MASVAELKTGDGAGGRLLKSGAQGMCDSAFRLSPNRPGWFWCRAWLCAPLGSKRPLGFGKAAITSYCVQIETACLKHAWVVEGRGFGLEP